MIELNLTHKESKKILELGYDFSPVCDRFVQELAKLKEPEYIEQEQFLVTIFRTETNQRMSNSLTPIIPKAALEACLPDLSYSTYVRGWLGHTLCDLDHREYPPNLITLAKRFNSVYEAFMWCHENYPEELKKEFEEVMGL